MSIESGAVLLIDSNGNEIAVDNGVATPANTRGALVMGSDGTNSRFLTVDASGRQVITGAETPGNAVSGKPVLMGGTDGSSVRVIKTATDGVVLTNVESWLGSTAPTVGQKTMANSLPVVLASDQTFIPAKITDGTDNVGISTVGSDKALKVDVIQTVGGASNGTIADGVSSAIKATVLDYTNSNPLAVRLTDTNGDYVSGGGGTQYTEDVASVSDPVGTQLIARRRDTLSSETTTDGDVTALNSTAKGELYVKHVDSVPVTDNGGSLTVDGTVTSNQGTAAAATAPWAARLSDGTSFYNTPTGSQLPAALVSGRLDTNTGAWLGSTAPTVGQKTMANSLPVAIASDQGALTVSGTVTANIGTSGSLALDATLTGGTQKAIVRGGAKGATTAADVTSVSVDANTQALHTNVTNFPATQAVSGTVTANQGTAAAATAPWAARLSDGTSFYNAPAAAQLPAALVGGRLDSNIGAWLGSTAPTVGSKTSANSVPVVIASDQGAVTVSGTVTAQQSTASSLKSQVQGEAAADAAVAGNPLLMGGRASDATPTAMSADGDAVSAWHDRRGAYKAALVDDAGDSVMDGTNNALRVNVVASSSSGGDGAIVDGVSSGIKATVLDYTNSNPLAVRLTDTNGDYVSGGGGTQYTEDAASASDPIGTQLIARRRDTLSSETTTDGDVTALNSTAKGELYVKHADTIATKEVRTGTGTASSVSSSATSVTILASNANRLGATVFNDSTQVLYLLLGSGTASSTNYTVRMVANAYFEVPFGYTGVMNGAWATANGNARVTEFT